MKKQILTMVAAAVVACLANSAQAQGTIFLNNYDSFIGVYQNSLANNAPLTTYVEILGGATALTMAPVVSAGLLSSTIPVTDDIEGPGAGSFFDGGFGIVNGVGGGGTAFLQVVAWIGPSSGPGLNGALSSYYGTSTVWSQAIGTVVPAPPSTPTPASLTIPGAGIVMIAVPEPTTLALAGLGGLALLAFRRRS